MRFEKLRIVGFKTFVDPTEFLIEPGLTGVVGPNGCGKSNLVEAMRWVMGETSFKSMRASAMDDVIFNGSGGRPARNTAEVVLTLDNSARTAPAAFNDADKLEISRRIEREEGSTYRINAREARARDVQILFADSATGARSPAMVRQGQIGEIIAARPQARRRVLEDAAGVAGLHARRHEAELRLKATEENLVRVEDVLKHLDGQVEGLAKQARQSVRYRDIAAQIRRAEALALHLALLDARDRLIAAERQFEAATRDVAERMRLQGEAARAFGVAEHAVQPLRDEEAARAAALQRLRIALEQLDAEEQRGKARQAELEVRTAELESDIARARQSGEDAERMLADLARQAEGLDATGDADAAARTAAAERSQAAETALAAAEQALAEAQGGLAALAARRAAAERALAEARTRLARADRQAEQAALELEALRSAADRPDMDMLARARDSALAELAARETAAAGAERTLAAAREAEQRALPALAEAERLSQRLDTEIRTLRKLLDGAGGDLWPPILDEVAAAKGYEAALGAALGDDLDASSNVSAPVHWAETGEGAHDPPLPPQVRPLAEVVSGPPALRRRLRQIGLVAREEGAALRRLLKPGQRLVSREGDVWRWDGFTAAAEAPSPAARRLAEKNRLGELETEAEAARGRVSVARAEADALRRAATEALAADQAARAAVRAARLEADRAREAHAAAERRDAERLARARAVEETAARLGQEQADASAALAAAEAALAAVGSDEALTAVLAERRAEAAQARAEAAEARAALQSIEREAALAAERRRTVTRETEAWRTRRARAAEQADDLAGRLAAAEAERAALAAQPDDHAIRRRALLHEIDAAESARKTAADRRAEAETALAEADRAARAALQDLASAREARARGEAVLEAAREALAQVEQAVREAMEVEPSALPAMAGLQPGQDLPPLKAVEERLQALKRERERIGPVNLRADEELQEATARRDDLVREREDLDQAVRKLRRGIQSLNAEGRERLLASFEIVNGHFRRLFTTLFDGGEAELQLIESDDPLEAGLEIMAKPPGKKPTVLTLLSGGEQALTATALVFAIFLTNPSPICVLDEIDAPLDDHNVERLCDLLDDMAKTTQTRFIIITHNPITMARMDRLFGVTMAEQGVSQLVSVDLQAAERLVA